MNDHHTDRLFSESVEQQLKSELLTLSYSSESPVTAQAEKMINFLSEYKVNQIKKLDRALLFCLRAEGYAHVDRRFNSLRACVPVHGGLSSHRRCQSVA